MKTFNLTLRLILFVLLSITSIILSAQVTTWDGGGDGTTWEDPLNWDNDLLPPTTNRVLIPFGAITVSSNQTVQSINIKTSVSLTINPSSTINIENAPFPFSGIDNEGTFTNEGVLNIGQTGTEITGHGFFNRSGVVINTGTIRIDNAKLNGLENSVGSFFTNNGRLEIGQNGGTSPLNGISNNQTMVRNLSAGIIWIDNTVVRGIFNSNSSFFTNEGQINIGQNGGLSLDYGITNLGELENFNAGTIRIDNVVFSGISNSGTVRNIDTGTIQINNVGKTGILNNGVLTNEGQINIGQNGTPVPVGIENVSTFNNTGIIDIDNISIGISIYGFSNFSNDAGGIIQIDNVTGNNPLFAFEAAIYISTELKNSGVLEIGINGGNIPSSTSNGFLFNNSNSSLINESCGVIQLNAGISQLSTGSITNNGFFSYHPNDNANFQGTFINNGILEYPQTGIIPGVTNNEIVVAPTTGCGDITAFDLGTPVDFNIQGIYTDMAATNSAGTYQQNNNTFTPSVNLATGANTLFVKILDSPNNCPRIAKWTLTILPDNTPPSITCPMDITVFTDPGVCCATLTLTPPTAMDDCSTPILVNDYNNTADASGTYFVMTNMVTWTATDAAGNQNTCTQNITVIDNEAPQFGVPDPSCSMYQSCYDAQTLALSNNESTFQQALAACNGDAACIQTATQDKARELEQIRKVFFQCLNGNTNCSLNPVSGTLPDLIVAGDGANCEAQVDNPGPVVAENCAGFILTNDNPLATNALGSGIYPEGTTTVTWTATDQFGNASTITRNIIVTNQNCNPTYCASSGQSTQYEWIESITVNGMTNTSGNDNGYGDYTNVVIPITTGSNSIQLTPGFAANPYLEFWRVFIDFNQNDIFEANEIVSNNLSFFSVNGTFSIPNSALTGQTRMRVSMRYGYFPQACDNFSFGEVEDYTVDISQNPNPISYCTSQGNDSNYNWIKKVKLQDINNNSGNNGGYADFTNMSTDLYLGETKSIQLKPGFNSGIYNVYWRVWIDWNQDGDFNDWGEREVQKRSSGTVNKTISVPNNAFLGTTRMRVSMRYGWYPFPCQDFHYGEVEDYTIEVKSVPSQGLVADNNPELNLSVTKKTNEVQLDWINNTGYKNEIFIIEKSTDGQTFTPLKEMPAFNDSEDFEVYSELDEAPQKGMNYYRIKLILDDGSVMYSNTQMKRFNHDPAALSLYPNPTATDEVFINLKNYVGKKVRIEIANQLGQLMHTSTVEVAGEQSIPIALNGFKAGHYTVSILVEGKKRITKPLVVVRL